MEDSKKFNRIPLWAVERSETDHGLIRVVDPYVRLNFSETKVYGKDAFKGKRKKQKHKA